MLPPENVKEILWGNGPENREDIPKIIWLFWDGEITSPVVKACIRNLKKFLAEYSVRILNKENLTDYLPKEECLFVENLPLANYTDLLRLNLLRYYGGFWLDASILITENFDWVYQLKNDHHTELVAFYSDLVTTDFEFPILETWFLAAPKNSRLIEDWYFEFKKCYYSPDPHHFYQDIKNDPQKRQGIKEDWLFNYLIAYQSAMKIMRNKEKYRLLLLSANDSAHFYNFNLKLKGRVQASYFLKDKPKSQYPKIIKFEKNGRAAIDAEINFGRQRRNSLLFTLSEDPHFYINKIKGKTAYTAFLIGNIWRKYVLKSNPKK